MCRIKDSALERALPIPFRLISFRHCWDQTKEWIEIRCGRIRRWKKRKDHCFVSSVRNIVRFWIKAVLNVWCTVKYFSSVLTPSLQRRPPLTSICIQMTCIWVIVACFVLFLRVSVETPTIYFGRNTSPPHPTPVHQLVVWSTRRNRCSILVTMKSHAIVTAVYHK
jgi:hypothetical protein